nr:tRNA lysidine(34) synthetase TilS [Aquitalea sp. LB_tupeE]
MQPDLLEHVLANWPDELSGLCAFELGLSGGLDSVVLLSLLARARAHRPGLQVSAVHVHHGLNPAAEAWVQHCQQVCTTWDIPLRVVRVQVDRNAPQGVEACARQLRYEAYQQTKADVVVLAQHLDDQAETVLLQLLRGGGVRALAGMPVLRQLAGRPLWRPLLQFTRLQLEHYAGEHALSWVEDDSNDDLAYRRNMIRHRVMPLLQQHIPAYRRHIARSAWHMAQASQLLDEVIASDLSVCLAEDGLGVIPLLALSEVRQGFVMLAWLQQWGVQGIAPNRLQEFLRQLRESGNESQPTLQLDGRVVLRYRQSLHVVTLLVNVPNTPIKLDAVSPQDTTYSPEWAGGLRWRAGGGLSMDVIAGGLTLRPRVGGELLMQPYGRKEVRKLLQEAGMPPLLRKQWPLLCSAEGKLLAVPGVAVASDCSDASGFWPDWLPEMKKAP